MTPPAELATNEIPGFGRFQMIDLPILEVTVMAFRDVGQDELGTEVFAISEVQLAGEPAA